MYVFFEAYSSYPEKKISSKHTVPVEPRHEKTCLRGFDKVRLNPAYAATEAS